MLYRAAILLERLDDVRSLADRAAVAGDGAPWEEAGRLIARAHRAGLDHADLNAHNLLFDHHRARLAHRLRSWPHAHSRHRLARAQPRAPEALAAEAARQSPASKTSSAISRDCARRTIAPGTEGY